MSIVIPRSRSALSLSKTQAYLNEPFPSSAASFLLKTSITIDGVLTSYNLLYDNGRYRNIENEIECYEDTYSNFSIVRLSMPYLRI